MSPWRASKTYTAPPGESGISCSDGETLSHRCRDSAVSQVIVGNESLNGCHRDSTAPLLEPVS